VNGRRKYLKGHKECGQSESQTQDGDPVQSAEIERICDTGVLEEHAVATFRVTVTISAALVQDVTSLLPIVLKGHIFAAFSYNSPSHFSVYLNLIQSPLTGRQHFL
jgi:hypothetical protein